MGVIIVCFDNDKIGGDKTIEVFHIYRTSQDVIELDKAVYMNHQHSI